MSRKGCRASGNITLTKRASSVIDRSLPSSTYVVVKDVYASAAAILRKLLDEQKGRGVEIDDSARIEGTITAYEFKAADLHCERLARGLYKERGAVDVTVPSMRGRYLHALSGLSSWQSRV